MGFVLFDNDDNIVNKYERLNSEFVFMLTYKYLSLGHPLTFWGNTISVADTSYTVG